MRRTLVVLALLFAVAMSDKEVDDSLIKCEKEADASVKCLDGCKAKHSGEKEVDKCVHSECAAEFEAEMACLKKSYNQ